MRQSCLSPRTLPGGPLMVPAGRAGPAAQRAPLFSIRVGICGSIDLRVIDGASPQSASQTGPMRHTVWHSTTARQNPPPYPSPLEDGGGGRAGMTTEISAPIMFLILKTGRRGSQPWL